jgi:Protein of unknown function (DUF3344)
MRNLGYGTISITGVPAGATVKSATLLWDILAGSSEPAYAQGTLDGQQVNGSEWASGASPCWPVSSNFSYEADVTSLVEGNGSYALAGFASGDTNGQDPWAVGSDAPLLEGASLVVVYQLASMPQVTVQIAEGATETDSGNSATATLSGFTVGANPALTTTYIVADGQAVGNTAAFDGATLPGVGFPGSAPQAVPPYSQGNLWDNVTADVSSYASPGDTSVTAAVTGGGDCLVWVGQVLSVNSTSLTHYELDLKLWIPQAGVVDPANPTGTLAYPLWEVEEALGFEPDLSNPNPNIGPFEPGSTCKDPTVVGALETSVSSFLDGDNYTGYSDGTTYRAAATISFDWDGSSISNLTFTAEPGLSHRSITEVTGTGSSKVTRNCVEYHLGTASVTATKESPSTLDIKSEGVVGFLTSQAHATGAYPTNSWEVAVNPDGSLNVSYTASRFPTTGLQVLINGQVEATDIVNDASCYKPSSLLGLAAVPRFLVLFDLNTKGSLPTITPGGTPTSVDVPSPSC